MIDEFYLLDNTKQYVGVDEVGRGPIAGPVVAAAVILSETDQAAYMDSKTYSEQKRLEHAVHIMQHARAWSVSFVDTAVIDQINILQATQKAMWQAVDQIKSDFDEVLVDGNRLPAWHYKAQAIIKGDQKVRCIAAASIIAKVFRDQFMYALDHIYPAYGFKQHKGYPTKMHLTVMNQLGPCDFHRKTFAPVANCLNF